MTHLNGFSKNLSSLLSGFKNGGGERARTVDPLRARQVLSQLSYTPMNFFKILGFLIKPKREIWWA